MNDINQITKDIIGAAIRLHKDLGPGLFESVYQKILANMLERRGHTVQREQRVTFEYDGVRYDEGFRVDMIVDGCVLVELKSVEKVAPVHSKQVLTYLRLTGLQLGLLLNFGSNTMKEGIHRVANGLVGQAS